MNDLSNYNVSAFEGIKHINEYGQEFWYARELQVALEYSQWRRFNDAISRAMEACINSGAEVSDHFAEVGKIVEAGATHKTIRYRTRRIGNVIYPEIFVS